MKAKELEHHLSSVKPFPKPKLELEQYATDAHIAARMIYVAATSFEDIEGRSVLDLGCGCGMLSLGALMMGAERIVGVDIDPDALQIFRNNMEEMEVGEEDGIELINGDVLKLEDYLIESFDTVLLNPPFGTKDNAGIDMLFLHQAIKYAKSAVYSMHKTSTRDHIVKKASDTWNVEVTVIAQMKFEILSLFKFHKKEKVYVDVDLIRFEKKKVANKIN